jgi:hypothetical protein
MHGRSKSEAYQKTYGFLEKKRRAVQKSSIFFSTKEPKVL